MQIIYLLSIYVHHVYSGTASGTGGSLASTSIHFLVYFQRYLPSMAMQFTVSEVGLSVIATVTYSTES